MNYMETCIERIKDRGTDALWVSKLGGAIVKFVRFTDTGPDHQFILIKVDATHTTFFEMRIESFIYEYAPYYIDKKDVPEVNAFGGIASALKDGIKSGRALELEDSEDTWEEIQNLLNEAMKSLVDCECGGEKHGWGHSNWCPKA